MRNLDGGTLLCKVVSELLSLDIGGAFFFLSDERVK